MADEPKKPRGNPNWIKGGASPTPMGVHAREPKTSMELDVRALAQKWTVPAILTAAQIMMNKKNPPAVRLSAADLLLKRGHGQPIQPIANPDLTPLNFAEMSDDQLLANAERMDALLAQSGVLADARKSAEGKAH